MRLFVAGVLAATAVVAATATPAHACSCAMPDPRSLLTQSDGAFVGRLLARRDAGDGRAIFTFRVERRVKGALGTTVDVESATDGAACGLETTVGARIGLFLERRDGRWTSSLCWQVSPEDLLAAVRPLPPPNGRGPLKLLLAGRFGPMRLLALDAQGRTLAYGRGVGSVLRLSVCPGARRAAEAVYLPGGTVQVAIRSLPRLRIVRRQVLTAPPGTSLTSLRCETADGARLLVFHAAADRPERSRLERLSSVRRVVLWRGSAIGATLTERTAFVLGGMRGTTLVAVDTRTGAARIVGRIPAPSNGLVANAAGTVLAGLTFRDGSPRPTLFRVRLSPLRIVSTETPEQGDLAFVDGQRIALLAGGGSRARIYTPGLRVATRFRWSAYRSTVVASTAYGVGDDARLFAAPLPAGPERVLRRLPGPSVGEIVPVR